MLFSSSRRTVCTSRFEKNQIFPKNSGINGEISILIASKMLIFDKIAESKWRKVEIQPKFYPTFSNICPICANFFGQIQ
jgi:hypothetical protein